MEYELSYSELTGKVIGIKKGELTSFGLNPDNTDYQDFLLWNAKQAIPLDLNSTIEVVVPEAPTQTIFELPVVAPDFIVQSPKPKKNHMEAHAEAIAESKKDTKSIALMVLDMMVYIEESEKRLAKLEAKM